VTDDEVILEGGDRHGQPIKLSEMTHDGVGLYALRDWHDVYPYNEESFADFSSGRRVAVFEPALPKTG
jgi:hypothetical protein